MFTDFPVCLVYLHAQYIFAECIHGSNSVLFSMQGLKVCPSVLRFVVASFLYCAGVPQWCVAIAVSE